MGRTLIIAEVGSTHDGVTDRMGWLIRAAKQAGADACKFQWTSSPDRLATRRKAEDYKGAYQTIAFGAGMLPWLKTLCDATGIEFMCSVYLPEDIPVVAPLVTRFKVASFEAMDETFIKAHFPFGKPLIVSTGMTRREDLFWLHGDAAISLLHCVSAYPAPPEEMNLAVLRDGPFDGLSDHTTSVLTGAVAVGAGATILEKHLRLDYTDPANPDFPHSLPPNPFALYVQNVRLAERLMGSDVKQPQPSEAAMMRYRVGA